MPRTGWRACAAVALCLGLSVPLVAQAPPGPRVPPRQPAAVQPAIKVEEQDYGRLAEILVELAWLAEPLTFPCRLEAHADSTNLRVTGHVPNRQVRQRALELASRYSLLPVLDLLQAGEETILPPAPIQPPQLGREAAIALEAAFPHRAFRVECNGAGRVKVSGFVGSFEEKLAVSKRLRAMRGCAAVFNDTHVTTSLSQSRPVAKASPKAADPAVPAQKPLATAPKGVALPQPVLGDPYVSHGTILVPSADPSPVAKAGFFAK